MNKTTDMFAARATEALAAPSKERSISEVCIMVWRPERAAFFVVFEVI
jgi:hypothetical protein